MTEDFDEDRAHLQATMGATMAPTGILECPDESAPAARAVMCVPRIAEGFWSGFSWY